jgi:hypothetical protein
VARPPKYKDEFAEQAEKQCSMYGAEDKHLAKFFNVTERTINRWKDDYEKFCHSLKKGKDEFDTREIEVALRERAKGYSHPDVHISNYQGEITITEITKHYPPDPTSIIFWLCNRNRERWQSVNKTTIEAGEGFENQLRAIAGAIGKSDTTPD